MYLYNFLIRRSCSIKYSYLSTSSVTFYTIKSIINTTQGHLPFRAWLPYDCNKPLMFWITFVHQFITSIFATIISVGTDTLIFGLFLQTCVQFEIFECRLQLAINTKAQCPENFSQTSDKERTTISKYINHHLSIYKLVVYTLYTSILLYTISVILI